MKRVFLFIIAIIFNISLFSCTANDISENTEIEELATTGEDGDILPEEDDD